MNQKLKDAIQFIFGFKERELIEKIKYLLEQEFVYVYPDYSLELLEEKTGFDQKSINDVLLKIYKLPFYSLKRHLRVEFLRETVIAEPGLSLNEYAFYAGYVDNDVMVQDVKLETGLDFEDFCNYVQNSMT